METITLSAQPRSLAEKAKYTRVAGNIPAVIYGKGREPAHCTMEYQTFRRVFQKAGENTVIDLKVADQNMPVLVHDIQFDPVTDRVIHVDFIAIDMKKEVTAKVPLKMIGEAPAVKELAGILTVHKPEITIKCLPKDLLHSIDVDVSGLIDFHHSVHVKDLIAPAAIRIIDNPEDTVVNVTPPRKEEEKLAVVPEAGVEAPLSGAAGTPEAGAAAPVAGAGASPSASGEKKAEEAKAPKPKKKE